MVLISVAIVGAGLMARTHLEAIGVGGVVGDQAGGVHVQAICAPRSETSQALAASVSVPLVESYDQILNDDSIDAVDLCVPTEIHREYAVAALRTGKHVLVEKPLALTLEDAHAIADAAARSGRVAMTAMVLRFWPAYRTALELVRKGDIGTPQLISAQRLSPPPNWNTWMHDHSRSGGPVVDLMIHDLDFATEVLGDPVLSGTAGPVRGMAGPGSNHACVMVEHHGAAHHGAEHHDAEHHSAAHGETAHQPAAVSIVEGSWMLAPSQPLQSRFMIIGTEGNLVHSFTAGSDSTPGSESLTLYPTGDSPAGDSPNNGAVPPKAALAKATPHHLPISLPISAANPYAIQLEYFFDCIRTGQAPDRASIEVGTSALALALAAKEAIQRYELR